MHLISTRPSGRPRGMAALLAILLLGVLVATVLAMTHQAATSVASSSNHAHATRARLVAESGLSFMVRQLSMARLPPGTTQETFATAMCSALASRLDGTANLAGKPVQVVSGAVAVPEITTPDGAFQSWVAWVDANVARLTVHGRCGQVSRRLALDLWLVPRRSAAFDYGLASQGTVSVSGNARILGVNSPYEASVLSACTSLAQTVSIGGSVTVAGDVYASQGGASVLVSGTPSVGGSTDPAIVQQHIHRGVEAPDFPQLDVTPLADLATNRVDANTNYSGPNVVLNNARIAAGTNPVFSSDTVLNGVVYIESPNTVHFEGRVTLNGVVVTQSAGAPIEQCQIHFAGRVDAYGVEALPSTPEYAAVKEQTGTFVVAPGFAVTFAGNVSAVNGSIAADQLTFTGSAEGVIRGAVIGLADRPTVVGGNVEIRVDRANAVAEPTGFVTPLGLVPDFDSYQEMVGE